MVGSRLDRKKFCDTAPGLTNTEKNLLNDFHSVFLSSSGDDNKTFVAVIYGKSFHFHPSLMLSRQVEPYCVLHPNNLLTHMSEILE